MEKHSANFTSTASPMAEPPGPHPRSERRHSYERRRSFESNPPRDQKLSVEATNTITTVAISNDFEVVAFGTIDAVLAIHDVSSGALIMDVKMPAPVTCVR